MNTLVSQLTPDAAAFLPLLVQVTAVLLLALAVSHLALRRRAAARHAVLVTALLAVAAAPACRTAGQALAGSVRTHLAPRATGSALPVLIDITVARDRLQPQQPAGEATANTVAATSLPLAQCIAAIWLAGSAILLLRLAGGAVIARRLVRRATEPAAHGGGRRVGLSDDVAGPVSIGLFRPVILLPAALVDRLGPAQLRQVLEHESSHARRRDHLVALLQRLVAAACWPHPLVHLLNRSLDAAREQRCDNDVVAAGHDRLDYARTLLAVAAWMAGARSSGLRRRGRVARAVTSDALVLGMPRGRLERRVAELVDERRNLMTRASLPMVCTTAAVFAAVAVAASAVTGVARADAPTSAISRALAVAAAAAAATTSAPAAPQQPPNLALHLVPVELGDAEFHDGDAVTIEQVWCTGQTLGPGEICIVRGTYTLASRETADLCLFTTSRERSGPTPVDPRQRTGVTRGSGHFELRTVLVDGFPHVSFYAGNAIGGVYFGQGDSVLRKKGWSYKEEKSQATDRIEGKN